MIDTIKLKYKNRILEIRARNVEESEPENNEVTVYNIDRKTVIKVIKMMKKGIKEWGVDNYAEDVYKTLKKNLRKFKKELNAQKNQK